MIHAMQPQTKDAATTKIKARKREDSSLKRKPKPAKTIPRKTA